MDVATLIGAIVVLSGTVAYLFKALLAANEGVSRAKDALGRANVKVAFLEGDNARMRAEAEGRAANDKAIIIADGDTGLITEWNQGATLLFHWQARDMLGKSISKIMPQRYALKHVELMSKWRSEKRAPRGGPVDLEGLTKDGAEIPIRLWLKSWADGYGKVLVGATIEQRAEEPKSETPSQANGT